MEGILIPSLLTYNIILWLIVAGRSFCSLQKRSDGSCLVFSSVSLYIMWQDRRLVRFVEQLWHSDPLKGPTVVSTRLRRSWSGALKARMSIAVLHFLFLVPSLFTSTLDRLVEGPPLVTCVLAPPSGLPPPPGSSSENVPPKIRASVTMLYFLVDGRKSFEVIDSFCNLPWRSGKFRDFCILSLTAAFTTTTTTTTTAAAAGGGGCGDYYYYLGHVVFKN